MLALLKNYIKTIFLSTDIICKDDQVINILGASYTDLYEYGVIHRVIGVSLTNLEDYSCITVNNISSPTNSGESQDIILNDLERIALSEDVDDNVDLEEETISLSVDESIQIDDFENLEKVLKAGAENDTNNLINASGTLGKLKGSNLYESLRNSEEIRNKVSQLLDRVSQNNPDAINTENSLLDMSEFLNT